MQHLVVCNRDRRSSGCTHRPYRHPGDNLRRVFIIPHSLERHWGNRIAMVHRKLRWYISRRGLHYCHAQCNHHLLCRQYQPMRSRPLFKHTGHRKPQPRSSHLGIGHQLLQWQFRHINRNPTQRLFNQLVHRRLQPELCGARQFVACIGSPNRSQQRRMALLCPKHQHHHRMRQH